MALKLRAGGAGLANLPLPGKLAIGLMFTLMVGLAYFVVFYSEIDDNIEAQVKSLTQKKKELVEAEEAKAAYMKDLEEKARRESLSQKQKKILPDAAESPAFLSTIQTVATISGVKLTSWTPLDEEPAEFYVKVPMALTVSGRFHQVSKFFHGIGQVDRVINMENINIKLEKAKVSAAKKKGGELSRGEETIQVKVECLATAFRALSAEEGGGGRRKRGKGKRKKK
jgi:type IV pilus assembly protein PilO